ncbi:TnpV protein [Ruminococcus sp. JE7B6]|uniref:TnpV protein n=1 Tax=Ruminococcus sp. JE7B6 TaxID=3233380 RepID=UPI003899B578
MWHLDYLKHHRKFTYNRLQTECKLNFHLCDINSQAEEMFDTLIKQLKESEGITEQLKAENQMEWVARMNNIRNRATEIINHNIIYN